MKKRLLLLLFLPTAIATAADNAKPINVLFLMCDEHNPSVMGCSGDPLVKTPTLDSLAATGVRFSSAYCQNPICVPSRVSLVSGRMPCHLKTFGNTANQKYEGMTTLADVFTKAGYQAVWYGKTHWGDPRFMDKTSLTKSKKEMKDAEDDSFGRLPQQSQVSEWPVAKNPEHATAEQALAFLDGNKGKPFFLGVSFSKPHFPYTIQQEYYDLYKGKVKDPVAGQELIHDLPALNKIERAKYGFEKATAEDISRTRALYYGMVTYVDWEFSRILKKLDELGVRENTIIIYTADHGEMLGNRGLWYKNTFYDGGVTIPFIWNFPKELAHGKVSAAPVMNMDIFPTLCELCKLPAPSGLEGSSLIPVLKGSDDGKNRYALSENYRSGFQGRMIRTQQWKYFFYTNGDEYLYDMLNDPGEVHNLAKDAEHKDLAASLKKRAGEGWIQQKEKSQEKKTEKAAKVTEKYKKDAK